jgi:hypothetical protein
VHPLLTAAAEGDIDKVKNILEKEGTILSNLLIFSILIAKLLKNFGYPI